MHSQSSKIHDNSHNTCKYQDISAEIESDFLCCQVCCEHYTEAEERSPRVSPCGERLPLLDLFHFCCTMSNSPVSALHVSSAGHTLCHACITSILAIADPNCPFCKHWYPAAATNYTFPKNFIVLVRTITYELYNCRQSRLIIRMKLRMSQEVSILYPLYDA